MNAAQLLTHFDRISAAPDALARLRQFILDLAVRGKLVPQSANDQPASELLIEIRGNAAQRKLESEASDEEGKFPPLQLPAGWARTSLGKIANIVMGQSPPGETYNKFKDGVPLINGPVEFTEGPFGTTVVNQYTTAPTNFCNKGDLLICVRGSTTGRTNIAGFRACIGRGVAAIQPLIEDAFIRLFIWKSRDFIIGIGRGIAFPSVSRKQIEELKIDLPPLAEQRRIVAKVDELMALCDQLEAARTAREEKRSKFSAATLQRLNQPDPDAATLKAHAKFAIHNITPLTTRPEQIKQIRETIINLAVRGKLVPQDPKDEPASELLKRIAKDKATLVVSGAIKKAEAVVDLTASVGNFHSPVGWAMTNLQSICTSVTDGDHLPPPKAQTGVPFLVIGNVRSQRVEFEGSRFVQQSYYDALDPIRRPQSGDLLYTLVGSYGIPVIVRDDRPFCVQRHIGILRPSKLLSVNFLACAMESRFVFDQAAACATGIAQKTVPLSGLRKLLLPLPPIAEQHRIVAKVDELMALCDQLQANLSKGVDTTSRLLDALLHEALNPKARQLEAAE